PYTAGNQTTLSFSVAGYNSFQTVTVSAAHDADNTDDTVTISLTGTGVTDGSMKVKVIDDDVGLILSETSLTMDEGGASKTFDVRLDAWPGNSRTVTLSSNNSDVTVRDTDPNTPGDQTALTFAADDWDENQTVTVSAAQDDDGINDSAAISLKVSRGGYDGKTASVTVNVTDDDTPGLTVSRSSLTVDENSSGTFTVKLDTQPSASVTVSIAQTGTTNADVTTTPVALTFTTSNWGKAQTVTVRGAEDADGFDDSVTLEISAAGGGYDDVADEEVEVTVTDNDPLGLTVSKASLTINENSSGTFTVKLDTQPRASVTVSITQPANPNADVTTTPASLTFSTSNWGTAQTVTVRGAEDADGLNDSATLSLKASGGGYTGRTGSVSVRVTDDDGEPLTLSKDSLKIREGMSENFTVQLSERPSANVTVELMQPANTDVRVDKTSLSFTASNWNQPQTVRVTTKHDSGKYDDRATIALTATGTSIPPASVQVTVMDDEDTGVEASRSGIWTRVNEGGTLDFGVYLSARPGNDREITLKSNNSDVTLSPNKLTFTRNNWDIVQTVTATAKEDDNDLNEQVRITYSDSRGTEDAFLTPIFVNDNDKGNAVVLNKTVLGLDEGADVKKSETSGTFTVRLSSKPSANRTVNVGSLYSKVTVDPTSLTFTPSDWDDPQTVRVGTKTKSQKENYDEVITLEGPQGSGLTGGSLRVFVQGSKYIGATLSTTTLSVDEGGSESFTVRVNSRPYADRKVRLNVSGGENAQATLDKTVLTFTQFNWDTPQRVTVKASQDANANNGTVTIRPEFRVINADGAYGWVDADSPSLTVSVLDDEIRLNITPRELTVNEGGSGRFKVRPATRPSGNVTVSIAQTGAVNPDVTFTPASLTFTASNWETARTVTVSGAHDADGADDSATLSLTASGGDYTGKTGRVSVGVADDDDATLELSTSGLMIREGMSDDFTVRLSKQPSANVTVTLSQPSNTDVTVSQTSLSFTASNWNQPQTVTVRTKHDPGKYDDKATINLAASGAGIPSASVGVTVTDDEDTDVGLSLSGIWTTVNEGGTLGLGLYLSARPGNDREVTLASNNPDVTLSPEKLTFTRDNYDTAQTVTVTAAEDDNDDDESVRITNGGFRVTKASPFLTLVFVKDNDNNSAMVLNKTSLGLDEGATHAANSETSGTFTVRLASKPSADRTVNITSSNPNVTFAPTSLSFTRDDWKDPQTVRVGAKANSQRENYGAVISLRGTGVADHFLNVSVQDPKYIGATLSTTTLSVNEGDSESFTVRVNSKPRADRTVRLNVSGGENAQATLDKTVLTFTPFNWDTPQRVTVNASQDANAENGTVTIRPEFRVINADGAYGWVNADSPALAVSVLDDEIRLSITPGKLTVNEGGSGSFDVSLASRPTGNVTVSIAQTGAANPDVIATPASLTFTADNWGTAQAVTVSGAHDADGTDDSATLLLTGSGGGYTGKTGSVSVSVTDDDDATLELSTSSLTIREGMSDTFTVQVSKRPSADVEVTLMQPANTDVTVSKASLDFTASNWNQPQTVTVTTKHDSDKQDDKAAIELTAAGTGIIIPSASVQVTVTDDEDADVRLNLSGTWFRVNEGGTLDFGLYLGSQPSNDRIITLASNNPDVTLSPERLTFTPDNWYVAQPVTVNAAEDDNDEDEEVRITHSGLRVTKASLLTLISVNDNDTENAIVLSKTRLGLDEGATHAANSETSGTFTVRLSSKPGANRTVNVNPKNSKVTVAPTSLTFTPSNWDDPQTVRVGTATNNQKENYSDTIELDGAGLTRRSLRVLVQGPKYIGAPLSPTALSVNEGSSKSFTVRVSSRPNADRKVRLDVSGGTNAQATLDREVLTFTPFNWDTPQRVTVRASQDSNSENGTVTIRPQFRVVNDDRVYEWVNASSPALTVSVVDDDVGLVLSPSSLTVGEGGSGEFSVKLVKQPRSDQEITLSSDNTDVTINPTTLNFTTANWNSAETVTVRAANDADKTDDSATIDLTGTGVIDGTVTVNVTDDDDVAVGLTLSTSTLTINEGSTLTFKVKLADQPGKDRTVSLSSNNSDVTVDTDTVKAGNQTTLTFTTENWDEEQTVTVRATHDGDAKDGSATINLTGDGIVSGSVAVSVTNDDVGLVLLSQTSLLTAYEGGRPAKFDVSLAARPDGNRTVNLASAKTDVVTISPATLTFTTANWNREQIVTVWATQDTDKLDETETINLTGTGIIAGSMTVFIDDNFGGGSIEVLPSGSSYCFCIDLIEGTSGSFTVRLLSQPSEDVTVTVSQSQQTQNPAVTFDTDSATAGDQSTLTFTTSNWSKRQTVKVNTVKDDPDRRDEFVNLIVSGYGSENIRIPVGVFEEIGLITSPTSLTLNEGGTANFTFRLSYPNSSHRFLKVTSDNPDVWWPFYPDFFMPFHNQSGDTATYGTQVRAKQDGDTINETVTISLSGLGLKPTTISVTVIDDDDVGLELSKTELTMDEGGTATFTVKLLEQPENDWTMNLSSTNSDLIIDTDPDTTGNQSALNFTAANWSAAQTVTLSAARDADKTDDKATISLTGTGITGSPVNVKIIDDNIGLILSSSSLTINEGGTGTFTVKMDSAIWYDRKIALTSTNDDVTISPTTLTFTGTNDWNWNWPQTVTVRAARDSDLADDEAIINLKGAGVNDGSVTVNVADDVVGLELSVTELTVDEGSSGEFTVKLASQPVTDRTVTLASTNPDVTFSPTELNFTVGSGGNWDTAQKVTINAAQDDDFDNDSAAINLTGVSITGGSVSVTVTDDDKYRLQLSETSLKMEEGSYKEVDIKLPTELASSLTTNLSVSFTSSNSDVTVDVNAHQPGTPSTFIFTPSNARQGHRVRVRAAQDADAMNDTATISITASGGNYNFAPASLAVTVLDRHFVEIMNLPDYVSVSEGKNYDFKVKLNARPSKNVTVTFERSQGSDDQDSTIDTNAGIAGNQNTLTFTPSNWSTPQPVMLNVGHDLDKLDEAVRFYVTTQLGHRVSRTVDIYDDDVELSLSSTSLTIDEGGSGTFTVKMGSEIWNNRKIALTSTNDDVTISPSKLAFLGETFGSSSNWNFPQTVTVTAADDSDAVDDTATIGFEIRMTDLDGGHFVLDEGHLVNTASAAVKVTVTDDESGLTLSKSELTMNEDSNTTFTVKLKRKPEGDQTIALGSNNADVTVSPTTLTFTGGDTGDWNTQQTVTLIAAHDDDATDDKAIINLERAGVIDGAVEVTVSDDDIWLELSKTELTMDEGGTATFTAKLDKKPANDQTITLSSNNADVTVSPTMLTFTGGATDNWSAEKTVTLTAAHDDDTTDDEAIINLKGAGIVDGAVEVTVTDDDDAAVGLTLSLASLTMNEGASGKFEVKLASQPVNDRTVTLESTNPDVTFSPTKLKFTGGSDGDWGIAQTVMISAAQDDDVDNDSAAIKLTGDRIIGGSVAVTITDDGKYRPQLSETSLKIVEGPKEVDIKLPTELASSLTTNLSVSFTSNHPDVTVDAYPFKSGYQSAFTFTPSNAWQGHRVLVGAASDADAIDETATISITVSGGNYNFAPASLAVTVLDAQFIEIMNFPDDVSEGKNYNFTVKLRARPSENVLVTFEKNIHSDQDSTIHTKAGLAGNQHTLTFTPSNWSTPQPVMLSVGHDTDKLDEDLLYYITTQLGHVVSDSGWTYDDDVELSLSSTSLTIDEEGTGTFTVKMGSDVSRGRKITLTSTNDDVTISRTTLTFTGGSNGTWNTAQTVTVEAADDGDAVDDTATIGFEVRIPSNNNLVATATDTVTVTVKDNDAGAAGLNISAIAPETSEGRAGLFAVRLDDARPENGRLAGWMPGSEDVMSAIWSGDGAVQGLGEHYPGYELSSGYQVAGLRFSDGGVPSDGGVSVASGNTALHPAQSEHHPDRSNHDGSGQQFDRRRPEDQPHRIPRDRHVSLGFDHRRRHPAASA
ncbi:MAG: hypothetical protein ISN29_02960, partial [Gammaproteobacteria bacterium AqS3]|nr:hypothetical protein [Gammaproteobacteria bacterium AqS3]